MNLPFRIEQKESFQIIGYAIETTNKKKEGKKAIPKHWAKFHAENQQENLLPLMNSEPKGLLGVNVYNTDLSDSRQFTYYIAVASNQEVTGLDTYTVPASLWAIFSCTMETIGKTQAMAITKWLPKSKYKALNSGYLTGRMKSEAPDIECYGQDGYVEVWVAVKEK